MAVKPVVLVADDDPSMRELVETMFAVHGGFRIGGVATDGLEAAMLAADVDPDVVVMDYFMPRWDGPKAAEFIHKHCPKARIVAFSAVATERPDWADGFLVKAEIDRLIMVVESLLAARRPS